MEDANGRVYYANKQTKQTSWKKPVLNAAPPEEPKATKQAATKENVNKTVTPQVQDIWREVVDKKTGKTYYYNKDTKETRWTNPAADAQRPESALSSTTAATVSESLYSESHPRKLCVPPLYLTNFATPLSSHSFFPRLSHHVVQVCRESRPAVGPSVLGEFEDASHVVECTRWLGRLLPRLL